MDGLRRADRGRRLRHDPQAVLASGEARAASARPSARSDLGIWRATSWRDYGERAQAAGHGPGQVSGCSAARSCRSSPRRCRNGSTPTWASMGVGGVSNGIYPTDCGQAGRVHPERQPLALPVRRERGAARQVPRGARALPRHRQGLRLRHGGPGRLQRPAWSCRSTSCLALGRELRRGQSRPVGEAGRRPPRPMSWPCWSTRPARRARPRARCCRTATSSSRCSNADAFIPLGSDDEQLAFLPLCHVAERTFTVFLPLRSGAIANFAESVETVPDNVREVAPTTVLRRAAHLGALLFRHRHPHEGGDLDRPHWPTPGRSRIGLKVAERRARGPQALGRAWRWCIAIADLLVLDNIKRAIGMHRVRFAGTGAAPIAPDLIKVVPRAGRRHARGLRPDRELRLGHRHARPHQARHRRRRRAPHRAQDLAGGRDPAARPARLHGLPQPAGEDRRDAARRLAAHRRRRLSSTTRATSRSPTA